MTPYELSAASHAVQRTLTSKLRAEWELMRWQTWHLINIQLSKNDKYTTPKDMQRFPWEGIADKPATGRLISIEQYKKI